MLDEVNQLRAKIIQVNRQFNAPAVLRVQLATLKEASGAPKPAEPAATSEATREPKSGTESQPPASQARAPVLATKSKHLIVELEPDGGVKLVPESLAALKPQ